MIVVSIGFILGLVLWSNGHHISSLIGCPFVFGVSYLHYRWLQKVNNDKNGAKLKQI